MKNRIRIFLLLLLLLLLLLQLSPIGLGDNYDSFRLGIMVVSGILFLFSWNIKKIWNVKVFRIFLFVLLYEIILLFALSFCGGKINWIPIGNLIMVFLFVMISFMELSIKQYRVILNLFIWGTLFVGLSIIFTFGDGFMINERYMPIPKNQIAPILSVGFFIAFFLGNSVKNLIEKCCYLGVSFLLFLCICVFHARANIVALLVGFFVYYVFYKRKIQIVLLASIILISLLFFTPMGGFLYDAFFVNYDVSDMNSVSAGRTDVYEASWQFIKENWLFGGLTASVDMYHQGYVHNYLLYTLENYGIWGSLVLVLFYFVLLFEIGKRNICSKEHDNFYVLGCFVFIVPLIVSIFEYTYPYGPGSAVFMAYFTLGQYYRNELWKRTNFV